MPRSRSIPTYRYHKASNQAVVVIDGRSHYLGPWKSSESRAKYDRLVAEWLASGRAEPATSTPTSTGLTVAELILAFWRHAQSHYRAPDGTPSEELGNIKAALKPARMLYGLTPARDFGPLALRAIREQMITDGLARSSINGRVNRIRRAFRWAASLEMVPVAVVQALATVSGLQKGRTDAREPELVGPVPDGHIEATLPYLTRPLASMVRLQLLTGMRPGEVCAMRGRDLVHDDATWTYRPSNHKTAWRGRTREIVIGPKAREIVEAFTRPDPDAFLFDPRDSVAEHHASRTATRKSKPTPSETAKRVGKPGVNHARRYGRASYRNAILRACEKAGIPPWTPNQLRHSAATAIRAKFGLDAAQVILGHAKPDTTLIYAERDLAKAREIMGQIG